MPARDACRCRFGPSIIGGSRVATGTGRSSNGRTRGSGPRYRGSNPCLPAISLSSASLAGWSAGLPARIGSLCLPLAPNPTLRAFRFAWPAPYSVTPYTDRSAISLSSASLAGWSAHLPARIGSLCLPLLGAESHLARLRFARRLSAPISYPFAALGLVLITQGVGATPGLTPVAQGFSPAFGPVDDVAPFATMTWSRALRLRSEQRFQLCVDELCIRVVQPRACHVTPQRRDDDVAGTSNM